MTNSSTGGRDWRGFFMREDVAPAFRPHAHGVSGMWTPLGDAAVSQEGDAKVVLESLAKIASLHPRPDDWGFPYGPAMRFEDKRSPMHTDLTSNEVALLAEVGPAIPHAGLRARVFDVLSLMSGGPKKVEYATAHLAALLEAPIVTDTWVSDRDAWDRALTVARRYGRATHAIVAKLEQVLRRIIRTSDQGYVALQAADLLAKHNLATDRATIIGQRLRRLAARSEGDRKRAYLRAAASWVARGGDKDLAAQLTMDEVGSLMNEADELAAGESPNAMRAGHYYEEALQRIRQLPRSERVRLGVDDLPQELAERIRQAGALSLGSLNVFTSAPIDLTTVARDVRDRLTGQPIEDALRIYIGLGGWLSIDKEIEDAEKLIGEYPLQSMFGNIHYSADGRITYRSSGKGGTPIYGVDPAVWNAVIRKYELHMNLMVQGALWPGWVQLTNEHQLTMNDCAAMINQTAMVPPDRAGQFARAVYYGFNGDFSTAMQLLAPQMEALVRYHFANAGELTSTIDPVDRTEAEIGLSALMQRDVANVIFTRDLAFEIRALFCGPTGPNVRNHVAHGLVSDQSAAGVTAVYSWWFALRLIFIAFWNSLHDVDAAKAREPRSPGEDASDD